MTIRRNTPPGFTLIELLVVITIIAIIALIAVPAFTAMIASSDRTLANEALRTGLRSARAAALRRGGSEDVAVVFEYEPGGRTTLVTCVRAGEMRDVSVSPPVEQREIFVPLEGVDPLQLPKGWMVRGYAPRGSVSQLRPYWYDPDGGSDRYDSDTGNWVFPETGFYERDMADDGESRHSFMIRFRAGTGVVTTSPPGEVVVLSARPSSADRPTSPADAWKRADEAEDDVRFVRRLLTDRGIRDDAARSALLGDESGDTILVRPVSALALYEERKLAASLGVRLDPVTKTIYTSTDSGRVPNPRYPDTVSPEEVNNWIGGSTQPVGSPDRRITLTGENPDTPQARIFIIDRFTAELTEVPIAPLEEGS